MINSNLSRSIMWMSGAILSFTLMAIAGREVGDTFSTFEIMAIRSLIGCVVVVTVLTARGTFDVIRTTRITTHFWRNLFHFTGQNLWFFAVTAIPLSQVFALEFTSPIWVLVFSALIFKEPLTLPRVMAVTLGILGVLITVRPDFAALNSGVVAAGASAVFFALTMIFTRGLTQTDSTGTILFWLTTIQLCFGIVAVAWSGTFTIPMADDVPWLLIIGFAGLGAHYCVTTALSLSSVALVAPIEFVRLPIIALAGLLLYGEPIDIFILLGAFLIFSGNYVNILGDARNKSAT